MEVVICKTAGLCGGASNAYNSVIKSLDDGNKPIVYKEILHNEELIEDLKNRGAKFEDNIKNIKYGDTVILRAHGEENFVYDYLNENNIEYVDAICPNVKKVHDIALKKQEEGYTIIVVGKYKNGEYHDEVKSLISFLYNPIIIHNIEVAKDIILNSNKKYFLVSQTTFSQSGLNEIVDLIKNKANKLGVEFDYVNTICNFPITNIEESVKLAKNSDISIVVGSRTSSNTNELYNSVKDFSYTIFLNDIIEIKNELINYIDDNNLNVKDLKICILAGASTLKQNLQKLKNFIENYIK